MKAALNYLVVIGILISFSNTAIAKNNPSQKISSVQVRGLKAGHTAIKAKKKISKKSAVAAAKKQAKINKKTVAKPAQVHVEKVVHTKKLITIGKRPAKKAISTDTFNQMIDATDERAYHISSAVSRGVASVPERSAYNGSVVVAVEKDRNPVQYNPLLEEDRVEVKLRSLDADKD